jgi:hypothetical protein
VTAKVIAGPALVLDVTDCARLDAHSTRTGT